MKKIIINKITENYSYWKVNGKITKRKSINFYGDILILLEEMEQRTKELYQEPNTIIVSRLLYEEYKKSIA